MPKETFSVLPHPPKALIVANLAGGGDLSRERESFFLPQLSGVLVERNKFLSTSTQNTKI